MSHTQPLAKPPTPSTPAETEPPKTKLAKLLEERKRLDERIKQQQTQAAREKRQRETREKILIGAAIQKQLSRGS